MLSANLEENLLLHLSAPDRLHFWGGFPCYLDFL
jgi:hypothetical protein